MSNTTIFRNPACGSSRNVQALMRKAGVVPAVVVRDLRRMLPTAQQAALFTENGEIEVDAWSRRVER